MAIRLKGEQRLAWMLCSKKMSLDVSMVKIALALLNGILSYAPAALGSANRVSFALESSIPLIACLLAGMATAVPTTC